MAAYHSKKRIESWHKLIQSKDYAGFVADLLEHHYDPLYKKSRGPMLRQYADAGLLHCIELPVINQAYFQQNVVPQLLHLASTNHCQHSSHRNSASS